MSRNDFVSCLIYRVLCPAEVRKEVELEIAHVLFIDIVAYSKFTVNEQHARIEESTELFVDAQKP